MKIGIFADSTNGQAGEIFKKIIGMAEVQCDFFDVAFHADDDVSLDRSGLYWNGRNLLELDVAYIHGFSFMNPVVPSMDEERDWSVWQADYLIEQQKYSFLFSIFKELKRNGVMVINPPDSHVRNFMKPSLLEHIRRSGFSVPELLCSNDMQTVNRFCSQNEFTLWRPATGRAAWQLFLDKQKTHLIKRDAPPVLMAEGIEGPLVRGYFYDGKPVLMLEFNPPHRVPPERLEQFSHVEHPRVAEELGGLSDVLEAPWILVFFVLKDDRPWIYDVDMDPILDWLPDAYRAHVIMKLANVLAGVEEEVALP
ncbi:MAG: hypothetical protein JRJ85_11985, partial [Deltaproteobacteria bacterium]|nr:hypothetical protein [Deltaproteobacteria bacterium]